MVGGDNWQILSTHKYPVRELAGDYIRTSVGLILTAGPLFLVELIDVLKVILFLLSIIFLIFGFRTMIRQTTTVMLCDKGIRTEVGFGSGLLPNRTIKWPDLSKMRLRYFSTRRDREAGWMQLQLAGSGEKLAIDSAVDGFENVVAKALKIASANGLPQDAATTNNLQAMGLLPGTVGRMEQGTMTSDQAINGPRP
jgi:hypothetical protein